MSISPLYCASATAATDDWSPRTGKPAGDARGSAAPSAPALEATEHACREWLRRMARRDEAALSAFYDATVGRVYGMALRVTRHAESAAEVTGDVYLQAWRQADRYDPRRGKALAWLMTICRTRALDHLRRADHADTHPDPESLRPAAPGEESAHDLLDAVEEHAALHAALAQLEPLQRQLIALAFFRGLSHQEIATHTRMPLGSVKTCIRKALQGLRAALPSLAVMRGQK